MSRENQNKGKREGSEGVKRNSKAQTESEEQVDDLRREIQLFLPSHIYRLSV